MKNKKLVLIGKSAAGKDTLRNTLLADGFKPAISCTTRPIRPGETDGVNYHFISLEKFNQLESENFFVESETFRVVGDDIWKYGKSYESIENADVLIATVSGVSNMLKKLPREMFYIVEIECAPEIRFERASKRGDERLELNRRFKADDIDFSKPRDFKVDKILRSDVECSVECFIENFKGDRPSY